MSFRAVGKFFGFNTTQAKTLYNLFNYSSPPQVANGAINPEAGIAILAKASAGAYTLVAPDFDQEGLELIVTSRTAFAHTLTATGLLNNGTTGGPHNLATFAAFPGASIRLVADNGQWNVVSVVGVTVS